MSDFKKKVIRECEGRHSNSEGKDKLVYSAIRGMYFETESQLRQYLESTR